MADTPQSDADVERLAKLRVERDVLPIEIRNGEAWPPAHRFAWVDVDFLIQQIDARDAALSTARTEAIGAACTRTALWHEERAKHAKEFAEQLGHGHLLYQRYMQEHDVHLASTKYFRECAAKALSAKTTYRHKKRGTTYHIEGTATAQCSTPIQDGDEVYAYRGVQDGKLWVLPPNEFNDGRYEEIALSEEKK